MLKNMGLFIFFNMLIYFSYKMTTNFANVATFWASVDGSLWMKFRKFVLIMDYLSLLKEYERIFTCL